MVDIYVLWINTLVKKFNKWTKTSSPKEKQTEKKTKESQQQYFKHLLFDFVGNNPEYVFGVDKKYYF
jgi:hypothetical protein